MFFILALFFHIYRIEGARQCETLGDNRELDGTRFDITSATV